MSEQGETNALEDAINFTRKVKESAAANIKGETVPSRRPLQHVRRGLFMIDGVFSWPLFAFANSALRRAFPKAARSVDSRRAEQDTSKEVNQ